jgi:hypothetical protein
MLIKSRPRQMIIFATAIAIAGCTAALDFDSLQDGPETSDMDAGRELECHKDTDCDDGFDCTGDSCVDGQCQYVEDNEKCVGYDECKIGEGCVSGRECWLDSECKDDVECTKDICNNGSCQNPPDNTRCIDETNPCMIGSVCVAASGCTASVEVDCPQPDDPPLICEKVVCNPENAECELVAPLADADKDSDGYLDAHCGGDDCEDTDPKANPMSPEIHPGAAEVCNLFDDDCDGLTDVAASSGPVEVFAGSGLSAPDTAAGKGRFAVVWQRDTAVFLQVLGTGQCLTDTDCIGIDASAPASGVVNLTSIVGDTGKNPTIASNVDRFYVVWVAYEGPSPKVMLAGADFDPETATITVDASPLKLSSDGAVDIGAPQIDWNPGGDNDWVVVWNETYSDSTSAVVLADKSGHTRGDSPFSGTAQDGTIEDLRLLCVAANDCVLAYSFTGDGDDTNAEVFEARLNLTGGIWSYTAGWPRPISVSNPAIDDPSANPALTPTANGDWITSFTDVALAVGGTTTESESDIRALIGNSIEPLISDVSYDQRNVGFVPNKSGFGLLYVNEISPEVELDFRVFNTSFDKFEKQDGQLASIESGEIEAGRLIRVGEGYATTWIEHSESADDTLHFIAFTGCTPAAE